MKKNIIIFILIFLIKISSTHGVDIYDNNSILIPVSINKSKELTSDITKDLPKFVEIRKIYESDNKFRLKLIDLSKSIKENLNLERERKYNNNELYKNYSSAVVLIVCNKNLGSGILINNNGQIITNYHIIKDQEEISVIFKPEKGANEGNSISYGAYVSAIDKTKDLAIINLYKLPERITIIKLGDENKVKIGDVSYIIGQYNAYLWIYTDGIIYKYIKNYKWKLKDKEIFKSDVFQIQTLLDPGSSGGALINGSGELLGINTITLSGKGIYYAVSVNEIKKILKNKNNQNVFNNDSSEDKINSWNYKFYYEKYDMDMDGFNEVTALYDKKTRLLEAWIIDKKNEGKPPVLIVDKNRNKIPELYVIMYSDKYHIYEWDDNEDGYIDIMGSDFNGDGKIEIYKKSDDLDLGF